MSITIDTTSKTGHIYYCAEVGLLVEVLQVHEGYFDGLYLTQANVYGRPMGKVGEVAAFHLDSIQFVDLAESKREFMYQFADYLMNREPIALNEAIAAFAARKQEAVHG